MMTITIVFAIIVFSALGVTLGYAYNDANVVAEVTVNKTCDELYNKSYYWSKPGQTMQNDVLYEQCIKPIFPNGYPTELQSKQYFLDMECNDLGVHILKEHFEHELGRDIYEIKCKVPLESIDLPKITFEFSDTSNSQDTWIKSDESSYGSQYEDWK